jgi:hypothetical protein
MKRVMLAGQQATPNHGLRWCCPLDSSGFGVEEALAVERDAADEPVVEGALHDVDVARVAVEQEEAVVPEIVAHRGAGFAVGAHVGQFVVGAEGFAGAGGADAAGDVELLGGDVFPDAVDGGDVGGVAGERGDVGHPGVHIGGAHGVADGFGLLGHGRLRLVVGAARPGEAVGAARVQHELGEREVAGVAGDAVELGEAHFGDLVARPDGRLAGTEGLLQQSRAFERDVEQGALAGGLVVRDRGFVEVAEVVELVAIDALQFPAHRAGPRVGMQGIDGAGGVEVAVLFLRGGDARDQAIDVGIELGVGMHAEGIAGGLDHLVEVAVVEGIAGGLLIGEGLAAQHHGGAVEVADAAGLLVLFEGEGDGDGAVDLDARRPEEVVEMDGGEGDGLHRVVARGRLLGERGDGEEEGADGSAHGDGSPAAYHCRRPRKSPDKTVDATGGGRRLRRRWR